MKAVWYERTGAAPDVLSFGEMPTPLAGPGEVRVRLEASGVNPADAGRRAGSTRALEYPRVIANSDGAGIVDQIGDGVTRLSVGQRVWLYNGQRNGRAFGTAAEYIALAEHLVTPLPDDVSFAAGASLGIPCMTAWCCLFADGPIAGQTVLVSGGAGAVGHYAVQLAKWGGARVIATVSTKVKAERARMAGADLVINYRTEDAVAKAMAFTGQRGIDRVVDVDFGIIDVTHGAENKIAVNVYRKIDGPNETLEKEYLASAPLTIVKEGNTVVVRAQREEHHKNWSWSGHTTMQARYTIRVPAEINAELSTGGVEISATEVSGSCKADTSGGDLKFTRLRGPLQAITSGGHISLEACDGAINIETSGGKIEFKSTFTSATCTFLLT